MKEERCPVPQRSSHQASYQVSLGNSDSLSILAPAIYTTLLSLPDVVLRRILEFLLLAHEIEVTGPSNIAAFSYVFYDLAILKTCRSLYHEGQSVLRSNHFILVSTRAPDLLSRCSYHNIATWSKNLKFFKHVQLRLHIGIPHNVLKENKQHHFFLICLKDIDKFVELLSLYTYLNNPQFRFKFDMKTMPSGAMLPTKILRALLLPFATVRGDRQTCEIKGCVNKELVDQVQNRMMPDVLWQRARIRGLYQILKNKKRLVDTIFYIRIDDIRKAICSELREEWLALTCELYAELADLVLYSQRMNFPFMSVHDEVLRKSYMSFFFRLNHNTLLAITLLLLEGSASQAQTYLDNLRARPMLVEMPVDDDKVRSSALDQYLGVVHFRNRDYGKAEHAFQHAATKDPQSMFAKVGVETSQKYDPTTNPDRLGCNHEDDMEALVTLMPKQPYMEPHNEPVSVIAALDQELYALKLLGYDGDCLEGRIVQKGGYSINANGEEVNHPFDPASIDRQLDPILRDRAEHQRKGLRMPYAEICATGRRQSALPNPADGLPMPPPVTVNHPIHGQIDISMSAFVGTGGPGGLVPLPGQNLPEGLVNAMQAMGFVSATHLPNHHH